MGVRGPDLERASELEDCLIEVVVGIVLVAWIIGFGLASARAAIRLDRVALIWFAFGAVLGPLALLLLRDAPRANCRSCGTPTRGWIRVCGWCGQDIDATPATAVALLARMSGPAGVGGMVRDRPFTIRARIRRRLLGRWSRPPAPSIGTNVVPHAGPLAITLAIPTVAARIGALERDGPELAYGGRAAPALPRVAERESGTDATRVLATAVYVTGNRGMEPGRRYGIALHGSRLQILGPIEFDPSAIVLDRPAREMDATELNGRLVINEVGNHGSGLVIAFMAIAGAATPDLAETIRNAALEGGQS